MFLYWNSEITLSHGKDLWLEFHLDHWLAWWLALEKDMWLDYHCYLHLDPHSTIQILDLLELYLEFPL